MKVFEAIKEMRKLSKEGKSFSFSFMSYNRTAQTSSGIVNVPNARLRGRGSDKYNQNAEFQEEYLDLETNEPRRFWHCTLMTFNNKSLTI